MIEVTILVSFFALILIAGVVVLRERFKLNLAVQRKKSRISIAYLAHEVSNSDAYSDDIRKFVNTIADHAFDEDWFEDICESIGREGHDDVGDLRIKFQQSFGDQWEHAYRAAMCLAKVVVCSTNGIRAIYRLRQRDKLKELQREDAARFLREFGPNEHLAAV